MNKFFLSWLLLPLCAVAVPGFTTVLADDAAIEFRILSSSPGLDEEARLGIDDLGDDLQDGDLNDYAVSISKTPHGYTVTYTDEELPKGLKAASLSDIVDVFAAAVKVDAQDPEKIAAKRGLELGKALNKDPKGVKPASVNRLLDISRMRAMGVMERHFVDYPHFKAWVIENDIAEAALANTDTHNWVDRKGGIPGITTPTTRKTWIEILNQYGVEADGSMPNYILGSDGFVERVIPQQPEAPEDERVNEDDEYAGPLPEKERLFQEANPSLGWTSNTMWGDPCKGQREKSTSARQLFASTRIGGGADGYTCTFELGDDNALDYEGQSLSTIKTHAQWKAWLGDQYEATLDGHISAKNLTEREVELMENNDDLGWDDAALQARLDGTSARTLFASKWLGKTPAVFTLPEGEAFALNDKDEDDTLITSYAKWNTWMGADYKEADDELNVNLSAREIELMESDETLGWKPNCLKRRLNGDPIRKMLARREYESATLVGDRVTMGDKACSFRRSGDDESSVEIDNIEDWATFQGWSDVYADDAQSVGIPFIEWDEMAESDDAGWEGQRGWFDVSTCMAKRLNSSTPAKKMYEDGCYFVTKTGQKLLTFDDFKEWVGDQYDPVKEELAH